jgi:hypothetical protein
MSPSPHAFGVHRVESRFSAEERYQSSLTPSFATRGEMMLTGRRYDAPDAVPTEFWTFRPAARIVEGL